MTHQENPILRTTNSQVFVIEQNETMLKPEILTAVPAEKRNSDSCSKKCRVLFVIALILKCIIAAVIYSKYSKRTNTDSGPVATSIFESNLTFSTYSGIGYNRRSVLDDTSQDITDRAAVESIKESRLWDGPICYAKECAKAVRKFQEYVDDSVDPCDDFYGFVCGNFEKTAAKNESLFSTAQILQQNVQIQLKSIVTEPPQNRDANSIVLLKKFYSTCMNVPKQNAQKINYKILDLIRKLGGWPLLDRSWDSSSFSWMEVTKTARQLGLKYDWFVDVSTNDEGDAILPKISYPVPDLDIYSQLSDNDFCEEYLDLMVAVAKYYGAFSKKEEFYRILELEVKLYVNAAEAIENLAVKKKLWLSNNRSRDTNVYGTTTISEIRSSVHHPWLEFVRGMVMYGHRITASSAIVFRDQDYIDFLDGLFDSETKKKTAQNYVIWKTLYSLAAYLPEKLRKRFQWFSLRTVGKIEPRSETCFKSTNLNLFKALEAEYVRRFVNNDTKTEIGYLVSTAKSVLIKMVKEEHNWTDFATRLRLKDKTRQITDIIGGLNVMFNQEDYDKFLGLESFKFSSSNIIDLFREVQLKRFEEMFRTVYYEYDLSNKIEKFLTGWTSMDAKYHGYSSTMILCAATLQDDMYTRGRPNYLNLGALGSVLSHELAHGIETSVDFYISNGEAIPWITIKAKLLNTVQTACIEEEYTKYSSKHPDFEINTNGTIEENVADFAGINLAYRMYQRVIEQQGKDPYLAGMPQYSPNQLFWMQYASIWCFQSDLIKNIVLDEHAVPGFRVNGPLRNSRYFAKDFKCPSNSYMNSVRKCRLL